MLGDFQQEQPIPAFPRDPQYCNPRGFTEESIHGTKTAPAGSGHWVSGRAKVPGSATAGHCPEPGQNGKPSKLEGWEWAVDLCLCLGGGPGGAAGDGSVAFHLTQVCCCFGSSQEHSSPAGKPGNLGECIILPANPGPWSVTVLPALPGTKSKFNDLEECVGICRKLEPMWVPHVGTPHSCLMFVVPRLEHHVGASCWCPVLKPHAHISCLELHIHVLCLESHIHVSCLEPRVHVSCLELHIHVSCLEPHVHVSCLEPHVHVSCLEPQVHIWNTMLVPCAGASSLCPVFGTSFWCPVLESRV